MPRYGLGGFRAQGLVVGPFVGCRDSVTLASQDEQLATALRNVYPPLPEIGSGLWSRPGFTRLPVTQTLTGTATTSGGSAPFIVNTITNNTSATAVDPTTTTRTITGTGTSFLTQLSVGDVITSLNPLVVTRGGVDRFQHLGQYIGSGGTIRRFAITRLQTGVSSGTGFAGGRRFTGSDGRGYRLTEWSPSGTGLVPHFIDQTSVSMNVNLSVAGRLYSTTYADEWVLTDGVNNVRRITSGYVLSSITAFNRAFGPPAIYYGKLFFIDGDDRVTIRWSDENAFTGFTGVNAWALRQTTTDLMTCLIGTNDALYVFRENSITAITGAANDDFKSAGTLDAISNTTGTRSPDAVTLVESAVWFLDTYGRPSKIEPGRGLVPLWADCANAIRDIAASGTNLALAWARYDPATQLVLFGYRQNAAATGIERVLAFSARTEQYIGTWDISGATDLAFGAVLRDADNRPTLGMASGATGDVALYVRKQEGSATVSTDTLAASTPAPTVVVETGPLLGDPLTAKTFARIAVETENVGGGQATLRIATKRPTDAAFSSPVPMEQRTVASGMPGRATQNVDARQVRYAQFQVSNDPTDPDRVVLGRVAVYADQTDADPSLA